MNSIAIFVTLFTIGSPVIYAGINDKNQQNANGSTVHQNPKSGTAVVTRHIRVAQPSNGLKSLNEPAAAGGTVPANDQHGQVVEYIHLVHHEHDLEKDLKKAHEETTRRRKYENKVQNSEKKDHFPVLQAEARVYMHRSGNAAENYETKLKEELTQTKAKEAKYPASVAEEAKREEQTRADKADTEENFWYALSEPADVDTGEYVPEHEPVKNTGAAAEDVGPSAHKHVEIPTIVASNAHGHEQESKKDPWDLAAESDPFSNR